MLRIMAARVLALAPVWLVLQALQRFAGIELANVPYRDFAPAYQDLNQGRLHVMGTGVPTTPTYIILASIAAPAAIGSYT